MEAKGPSQDDLLRVLTRSLSATPASRPAEDLQLRMLCERAEEALTGFAATSEAAGRARRVVDRQQGAATSLHEEGLLRSLAAAEEARRTKRGWLNRLFGR